MANNWPEWLPIRSELSELTPYGAPQMPDLVALNTNENPFELPKEVVDEILAELPKVLSNLNRYPDRDAILLREKLAGYINSQSGTSFNSENIWAANGSNEILQTLMLACGGRGALGFVPSYSVHPLIAKVTGVNWNAASRASDFTLDISLAINEIHKIKPGLTFITTPNNPTGTILKLGEIAELAKAASEVNGLLVVDEAYAEFSTQSSAVTLISKYPNLVVVRTMSKAFAFAGARVGYLIGDLKVVAACLVARLPYHLSSLTQASAAVALSKADLLQAEVKLLISERERVCAELIGYGFNVVPSQANFMMFSGFTGSAGKVWQDLVDHGILIRDIGIPGYLRVTIGTPKENDQFLAAIASHKP